MMPLSLKLKRRAHKDIAYAQDLVVEEIYNFLPEAVMHGGTAIWRCYSGNRFSEDVDVYIKKDREKINNLFNSLEKKGFTIIKKRIKENSLYSTLRFNEAVISFEVLFKSIKNFILKEYETSEGILINIYTLSAEDLVLEKIQAYLKRKKIRDLYDIFFLLRYIENRAKILNPLRELIKNFKASEDETNLKAIIITGPVPSAKQMLDYIMRWVR